MHLYTAYKNFYTADFPNFKSRKRGGNFTVLQFCYLENGYVHIPQFKEELKVKVKDTVCPMAISINPTM